MSFENGSINTMEIESHIPSAEDFAQGIVFGNPVFEEIISRGGNPEEVRAMRLRSQFRKPLETACHYMQFSLTPKKANYDSDDC